MAVAGGPAAEPAAQGRAELVGLRDEGPARAELLERPADLGRRMG